MSTLLEKSSFEKIQNGSLQNRAFVKEMVLHDIKHYLPSQTPLRDFIHHNSLHAWQNMKFYDAIFKASKVFGYQVTLTLSDFRALNREGRIGDAILERMISERFSKDSLNTWKHNLLEKKYDVSKSPRIGSLRAFWKSEYKLDLDNRVQPILFRILCSYLDQGIAIQKFPLHEDGFLASVRSMEKNSFTSFFKTRRARNLFLSGDCNLEDLLRLIVGDEKYFKQYIFDQQFSHQGWSGMVSTIEDQPHTLLDSRKISLEEFIIFELLLEMDALDQEFGPLWKPLSSKLMAEPADLFADIPSTELNQVLSIWQDAFEWSYYDEVVAGLSQKKNDSATSPAAKSFQAIFCIDERECSLRRHLEHVDTSSETFGTPGFFNVEFYFLPQGAKFYDKLCPAPVTPKYLIKETIVQENRKHELLYSHHSHTYFFGFLFSFFLGAWAAVKLFLALFRPKMSPAISNAFTHMSAESVLSIENKNSRDIENDLQIGFTIDEMLVRVEAQLRGIGLTQDFAPLVYVLAHGSSSANNPHHGAHDCGACSGRPGSVNARVFASMANNPDVRRKLKAKGILIPENTKFIAGLHDTAADKIEFYDVQKISETLLGLHQISQEKFERALDLNAKERSRRFASINTKNDLKKVRHDILDRSVSLFEPRPELGHGTNTLCIVGRRELSKHLFLDRRAFLNSYDYQSDPEGDLLFGIMKPLGPVCGGINLEYYFSRVDLQKLGAGTKLPHNVMGLIGVANSCDGDLRPGLPLQMIEVHDPLRLLIVVEHFPEVVLKTIQKLPEMYQWFDKEWVHLMVMNPVSKQFFYFKEGGFVNYSPLHKKIQKVDDVLSLIENARPMESNYITDATKENLSVYTLNDSI